MKNHVPLDTDKMLAWSEDGIGWMVFNNPDKLNAMGVAMNAAIPTIMHTFRDDPDVRVVVMSGAGDRAFVSGADISEFEAQRSNPETIKKYDEIGAAAGRAYGELDKPIIAMIQGFCMGGGLLTALRADLRIASDDSQFGVPAARLGLGYGYGGVKTLVDLVGFPAAQEILLTGRRFPAADAARWGLVNRVTTREDLEPTVHELAATIAQNAPKTIRAIRRAIQEIPKDPDHRNLDEVNAPRPGLLRLKRLQRRPNRLHGKTPPSLPRRLTFRSPLPEGECWSLPPECGGGEGRHCSVTPAFIVRCPVPHKLRCPARPTPIPRTPNSDTPHAQLRCPALDAGPRPQSSSFPRHLALACSDDLNHGRALHQLLGFTSTRAEEWAVPC